LAEATWTSNGLRVNGTAKPLTKTLTSLISGWRISGTVRLTGGSVVVIIGLISAWMSAACW